MHKGVGFAYLIFGAQLPFKETGGDALARSCGVSACGESAAGGISEYIGYKLQKFGFVAADDPVLGEALGIAAYCACKAVKLLPVVFGESAVKGVGALFYARIIAV